MHVPGYTFGARIHEHAGTYVYAGARDADGLSVVAKVATPDVRDLEAEYRILQAVAGPGVAEALGLFESPDGPLLVQRRFGAGTLADALAAGPFPVSRALAVGARLARVLAHVHARRVLHRDLKPAHVLFDAQSDGVALGDFAVASELPIIGRQLPVLDLVGTPTHVSPEQTGRMAHGCDLRSDLYSLGVILYELLTGRLPFDSDSLAELVAAQLSQVPAAPSQRNSALPALASAIAMKLLAKSPDDRYQSARGLAIDLELCLEQLRRYGAIQPFELGRSDTRCPELGRRLYGRDAARQTFGAALARAAGGKPTLLIVIGDEGSGRGAFVKAMLREEARSALCTQGSWREIGDAPLSAIAQALEGAATEILLREDREVAALRETLAHRLGQVGQVIADLAPAWSAVLGPQPELPALGPRESSRRLQHAIRCLVAGLGEQQPVVLSLDPIDRADAASLSLLESLLDADGGRLLVVASTSRSGPMGRLGESPAALRAELAPLTLGEASAWTADVLACGAERAALLAAVLHERTGGLAGSFARVLEHLFDTGLIERRDGEFAWELARVRGARAPETLADHAARRVQALAPERLELLAAVACAGEPCSEAELAAALARDAASVALQVAALEREGLLLSAADGRIRAVHPEVAQTALAAAPAERVNALRGRLAAFLLASLSDEALAEDPFRVPMLLEGGAPALGVADRRRAAALCERAASRATALAAYDRAAAFCERGAALLADERVQRPEPLRFRLEVGLARSLMMLGQHDRVEATLAALCEQDLGPDQIGIAYASRADNHSAVMRRETAIEVGLEGLLRLGYAFPDAPPLEEGFAVLERNEAALAAMSIDDHVRLPPSQDNGAIAAVEIISTLAVPLALVGREGLYVLTLETALALQLATGHMRYYASLLSTHAMLLHSRLGRYDASRQTYEACLAVQHARPAPALDGRTHLVLYYLVCPWLGPWQECLAPLARAIQLAVEAGDPLFGALAASASITLMSMCGQPLDRLASAIDGWSAVMKADAGVRENAANVGNIAGKLARGEPVEHADLDRVTNVSLAAGAMRNNAMINLALALDAIGHEPQVRRWIDEASQTFPRVNRSQPHLVSLWLLEAIFAARDARRGRAQRLDDAEDRLGRLRELAARTGTRNHEPAIRLMEAEIARAHGEAERAAQLYSRATAAARALDLAPLAAYAMEQRAQLAEAAGCSEEADLFYREAAVAYRRWSHLTKLRQLAERRPELAALERWHARGGAALGRAARESVHGAVNESLDLAAVVEISQQISTQLQASDVVRVVLSGIRQNAGAQRVVFVLREGDGRDRVYGEVVGGVYRDLDCALEAYTELPESVVRLARRTASPLVIEDAASDPRHRADAFVAAQGCRSIAAIPVVRKGALGGFVVLENRLVPGAFWPGLVERVQALVAQAAIALDNASLYEDLERRVRERTAALDARNTELRLVLDNVSQGLLMVDRAGRLSPERSAIVDTWFGGSVPSSVEGVFVDDPMFGLAWEQLIDGLMPLELCIAQLPQVLQRAARTFSLAWKPIPDAAHAMGRMLLVLSDVTEAIRQQQAEQEQRQLMALFERLGRDREGVVEFAQEAAFLVCALRAASSAPEQDRRLLHTLKGNASVMGLGALSGLCHALESAMAVDCRGLAAGEREQIDAAWRALEARLGSFLDVSAGVLQVRRVDYERLRQALASERHPLAGELALWLREPLEQRFARIAGQAEELAVRLGRAPIRVRSEHGEIRLEREVWAPFWTAFIHAVRNALDHGLELPAERAACGKGPGMLSLRGYFAQDSLVLELADDGRGIAWERVRERARALGLPAETHDDLVAALCSDRVSTREQADEHSGRGVGMAALRHACHALGGAISVASTPGQGTTWRFSFPDELGRSAARAEKPDLR